MREFALKELAPKYSYWDKNYEYPHEQQMKMVELKRKMGLEGKALDYVTLGIGIEEVARGDFNCSLPFLAAFGIPALLKEASEELKRKWPELFYGGEKVIALCLTERDIGSDVGSISTTARKDGDYYILNGEKRSITSASAADVFIVWARTDLTSRGARGVSSFLVPKNTPGLSVIPHNTLGCRGNPHGTLILNNVRVHEDYMIGEEGRGLRWILEYFNLNSAFIGLMCLGAAEQSLDETIEYVKKRVAFELPIATYQGVAFPIVEAATLIEAARWLCYKILWMIDQGIPPPREARMAKWWVPEICANIIWECIVLHGHYGYSEELPLEQRFRDVLGWQIGDGTPQIQKLILARELLGRQFSPT